MPRVLVVKTSSLGDVIHTLPALTDAAAVIPGIRFDWVVEESFSEVPGWHPAVDRVIAVAVRRWRKHPWQAWRSGQWQDFKRRIGTHSYDAVIDAQGLLKSAWLTRYARGPRYGLDKQSAREPLASRFYQYPIAVARGQHAVERTRQLFAAVLGYELGDGKGRYNLSFDGRRQPVVVLLHGTTWASKHWPEDCWQALARLLADAGFRPQLPWGNDEERQRAERIAAASGAEVLSRLSLTELAKLLARAAGCVSVDTGLGHLAAAVSTPTVALFGPTNAALTGFYGEHQRFLQSSFHCSPCMERQCRYDLLSGSYPPCFDELSPQRVFEELATLLDISGVPVEVQQ